MPFQSEKQRRYLWANEPEIARDWTDTYGSRIRKDNGGIMDMASDGNLIHDFENYKKGNKVNVPTSFQARSHSTPVHLAYITDQEAGILQALKPGTPHRGPLEIPNYDDYDPTGGGYGRATTGAQMSGMETGSTGKNEQGRADARSLGMTQQDVQNIRSGAIAAGAGQTVNPGLFGPRHRPGISKQDLGAAKAFAPNAYRATRGSPFGIGNLFRGAASMFGGIPGKAMSLLSHIDPRKMRGINSLTGKYNTQDEYNKARQSRIDNQRVQNILGRKAPITQAMRERLSSLGYTGEMPGVGSTGLSRAIDADYDREGDDLYLQNPSKNYLSSIDLSKYDPARTDTHDFEGVNFNPAHDFEGVDFNNQGIRSLDTIANEYTPGNWKGPEIDINEDVLDINKVGPRITQIGGNGLQISQEMLEVPIKTLERTIANLEAGIEAGIPMSDFDKNQYERMKKVIEIKKKKGETAEGTAT